MVSNDPLEPMQSIDEPEEKAENSRGLEFFDAEDSSSSIADSNHEIGRGQVESMRLPAGWVSGEEKLRTEATYSYKEYHPADGPNTMICFFYRGRRADEESSKKFRDILAKPPHDLAASEYESIGQIVRDKRDPEDFTMTSCRTEDINGKRVLLVEGRYHAVYEDALAMFIDADKSSYGSAVQEIYFQAPPAKFQRYLEAAEASFRSIQWKR